MSNWATTTPRIYMNDANRNRFSNVPPPFENLKDSLGPCAYCPKGPRPKTGRAHLTLVPTCDGVPERQKEIYGTPVSKILPISATTYSPKGKQASAFDRIVEEGARPQCMFSSASMRQLWPKNDITMHPEVYPPGPMAYDLPDVSVVRSRSPVAIMNTFEERESNSPVQKDPLPSLSSSKLSRATMSQSSYISLYGSPSPSRGGGRNNNSTPMSSLRNRKAMDISPGSVPRPPSGPTIGTSPRHFNINNINSRFRRELDADYENPAPGSYNPTPRLAGPPGSPSIGSSRKGATTGRRF